MGRPADLTPKQWAELEDRYLPPKSESGRKLAAEFGISEGAIRKRFSAQKKQIETVANQMVTAERSLKQLPISTQIRTADYKDYMISMDTHLAGAGTFGAAISHRLKGIAAGLAEKVDDAFDPSDEKQMTNLKGIAALVRTSNESAHIAIEFKKIQSRIKEDGDSQDVRILVVNSPDND